jgi:hypothetical protein
VNDKEKPLLIALKAEKEALNFYARMAKRSTNPTGEAMFNRLMKEEKRHINMIEKQLKKLNVSRDTGHITEKASILSEINFEDPSLSDMEVLEAAIEDEQHAVDFYSKQAGLSQEEEEKKFYLQLVKEEEAHKQVLEKECLRLKKKC